MVAVKWMLGRDLSGYVLGQLTDAEVPDPQAFDSTTAAPVIGSVSDTGQANQAFHAAH